MMTGLRPIPTLSELDPPTDEPPPYRPDDPTPESSTGLIHWPSFWATDFLDADWLVDQVLARGRGHTIWAARKQMKSLFTLYMLTKLVTHDDNVAVVYLDYENSPADLYDRLTDMGYGPASNLNRLRYHSLPTLPPLDTKAGAHQLELILNDAESLNPGCHLCVVVDTFARALTGSDENATLDVQGFYRHSGIMMKRRGATWLRLDHAGKDIERGERGTSAKGDDIDVSWQLARTDTGIRLTRKLARMSWVPETVDFAQLADPLRFVPVAGSWPAGTAETARLLDELGAERDASSRKAEKLLREAGHGRQAAIVRAACRYRRSPDYETRNGTG
jgi:hypothetical protein